MATTTMAGRALATMICLRHCVGSAKLDHAMSDGQETNELRAEIDRLRDERELAKRTIARLTNERDDLRVERLKADRSKPCNCDWETGEREFSRGGR
jgi:outer membrane murein-binding lipoprotein Lpp